METGKTAAVASINRAAARGLRDVQGALQKVCKIAKELQKPMTDNVSFRITGQTNAPPQAVVKNPETGKVAPLIQKSANVDRAIQNQLRAAEKIVQTPPPNSPVPQAVNVVA
jgi:hypothetical protein